MARFLYCKIKGLKFRMDSGLGMVDAVIDSGVGLALYLAVTMYLG